jgi:hypothetical protein
MIEEVNYATWKVTLKPCYIRISADGCRFFNENIGVELCPAQASKKHFNRSLQRELIVLKRLPAS